MSPYAVMSPARRSQGTCTGSGQDVFVKGLWRATVISGTRKVCSIISLSFLLCLLIVLYILPSLRQMVGTELMFIDSKKDFICLIQNHWLVTCQIIALAFLFVLLSRSLVSSYRENYSVPAYLNMLSPYNSCDFLKQGIGFMTLGFTHFPKQIFLKIIIIIQLVIDLYLNPKFERKLSQRL